MDTRIYGPKIGRNDYGVYATRRYPKGGVVPSNPSDINARAPLPVNLWVNTAAIAPHAGIARATYTVPPRRRAVLQNAFASMRRASAPGVAAAYTAFVRLERANGSGTSGIVYVQSYNASPNSDPFAMNRGDMMDLYEGDKITLQTEDTSTGGTVAYTLNCALIEYNAEEAIIGSYSAELSGIGSTVGGGIAGTGRIGGGGSYAGGAKLMPLGTSQSGLASGSKLYPY